MAKNSVTYFVMKNLDKVRKFFFDNLDVKSSPKPEKLSMNCPYCHSKDTKRHLVINLDWGIVKCFRCGYATSIISLLKHFNKAEEFYDLLRELTDLSLYELQGLIKKDYVRQQKTTSQITDLSSQYIKDHHLFPAETIREAVKYAAKRTRKNIEEVSTYYADLTYLYIPVFRHGSIIAFVARKYVEGFDGPRYKLIKLTDEMPVAFLDEVEENISSNTVYITEGYFDAFAINSSFGEYCAIALFSKFNKYSLIQELVNALPSETNIVITLDSYNKDEQIYFAIDRLYNKLKGNFTNINMCLLGDNDPSYIFETYGPEELIRQINSYTISASAYMKKRIIEKTYDKDDSIDNSISLPEFLVKLGQRRRETNDIDRK